MSPTTRKSPIGPLNPISDDEAVDAAGRQTWADLASAIVATRHRLRDALDPGMLGCTRVGRCSD